MDYSKTYLELQYAIIKHGPVPCETEGLADLFFPTGPDHEQRYDERMAKEFCKKCPVKNQCAMAAIIDGDQYGIWGGLTPAERNKIRAKL